MLDVNHIYKEVLSKGEDWADKKAAYEALDDATKSVLADLMSGYMDGKTSRAEAEMRALASKEYKDYLFKVSAARRAWLVAQVQYDSAKLLSELRRSEESTRRAEASIR